MNLFRALAHADGCIVPLMKLGGAILARQKLSARSRELLILQAVALEGGQYELLQHVDIALGVGASRAEIDAVLAGDPMSTAFSAADRALLEFGREVVRSVRVSAPVFEAVRAHFSDQEIVESILAIGFYMTLARVTEALEIEPDPVQGMNVLNAAAGAAKRNEVRVKEK
jgi:alkylhydroperoxidase family enzyme